MTESCPNCDLPAIGSEAAFIVLRGTHETLPGVVCRCGNVWVDDSRRGKEGYGQPIEQILDADKIEGNDE